MTKSLKAVYENGLLRPLEPLPFKEHEVLTLTVTNSPGALDDLTDSEFLRYLETQADEGVTLEQVRAELSTIPGSMAEEIIQGREDRV
jgi:predicted DNA-binding antitoxin AbrB/MazE fold protein